jgi:two-component system, OmpR family, response regulator MprA
MGLARHVLAGRWGETEARWPPVASRVAERMLDRCQAQSAVKAAGRLNGRILLVDDDPHFLRVLARILKTENLQVCCAAGAGEAIRILSDQPVDVVISDLRMPECDGVDLVRQIRATGNEVPVIILTAYDEVDNYLEALNAGANEYLHKPVETEELLQTIRACLRRRESCSRVPPADEDAA